MAHVSIPEIPLAERKTFSLGEAAGLTGLCVSTLYNLMGNGWLQTIKVGGRRLVTREALDALLEVSGADVATTGLKVAVSKKGPSAVMRKRTGSRLSSSRSSGA
jgi:excisionase family DNA binding protein